VEKESVNKSMAKLIAAALCNNNYTKTEESKIVFTITIVVLEPVLNIVCGF
jgi:hypothetical protein